MKGPIRCRWNQIWLSNIIRANADYDLRKGGLRAAFFMSWFLPLRSGQKQDRKQDQGDAGDMPACQRFTDQDEGQQTSCNRVKHANNCGRQSVDMAHIKTHYFTSHPVLNANAIVPVGPDLDLDAPHDRNRFK